MKTKHYNGVLGTFDYDVQQFKIAKESRSNTEYLKYIGKENDGTKIVIPDGLVDAYRMFDGSSINSIPEIPQSVKYATKMFRRCTNISVVEDLPENVRCCKDMFEGCKRSVQLKAKEIFDQTGRGADAIMCSQRQGENEAFII